LLDVEWSGAVAPGATIKFIASASTNTVQGADLSALYAVDNDVAPVLSVSFGLCELSWARRETSSIGLFGSKRQRKELRWWSRRETVVRQVATFPLNLLPGRHNSAWP